MKLFNFQVQVSNSKRNVLFLKLNYKNKDLPSSKWLEIKSFISQLLVSK